LITPYTDAWPEHTYDYPSTAIWFFWLILVTAYTFRHLVGDTFVWGKIFLNLCDVGCGFVIYKITKDRLEWHPREAQRSG
ncbi:MAG: hypothetical protein ACFFCQ_11180, partial [Promethearchaeota archaeon]